MARIKTDSTRTNFYLPNNLITVGKQLAAQSGITFSELVRTAIKVYIVNEVKRIKEARDAGKAGTLPEESTKERS